MVEVQYRFRDDAPVSGPAVPLATFGAQTNAGAVRIEPGEDARELLGVLDSVKLVEVNFPSFGDGRGYSSARILREAGYVGELRAVGDVAVDQLAALVRCGFDSFAPDVPMDPVDVDVALNRWPQVYQATTVSRTPIWALRHGQDGRHPEQVAP